MRSIVMGVAALALVAGAASAQSQGQGRGNDRGGGNPAAAAAQGDGPGQGQGRGQGQAENRGRGSEGAPMGDPMRGAGNRDRQEQRGSGAQRGGGNDNRAGPPAADRGRGNDPRPGDAARAVRVERGGGRTDLVRVRDRRELVLLAPRRPIAGCPPGLARKNPPCVPPGLARNGSGWRSMFDRPDWWGLSRLGSGRYAYDDGYLLRLGSDGRIGGYIPLLGGALAAGNPWPSFYEPVMLPDYYVDYYGLGPVDRYRFADNVIYRVDPETEAITSIAALLTGDDFAVGRPMPAGYDVYNVPWSYRDQYYDQPDAMYRYSDGYIYQADPQTRLISAAIELLAS